MLGNSQTVTIWNRFKNPDDILSPEMFIRHILPVKCRYKTKINRTVDRDGVKIANSQRVIIPETLLYRPPNVWLGYPDFFTLQVGDVVALGESDKDITGQSPFTMSEAIEALRPNVFIIASIQDNTMVAQGRHYAIEGV